MDSVYKSANSVNEYLIENEKYGVNYFVESRRRDFLKNSDLHVVYVDDLFVIYKANY